jgi:DNA-binding GntR family transcriptional regulator
VRTLSREDLHEAFLVRAELESLATELAATRITDEELAELEEAENRFAGLAQEMRGRDPGGHRREVSAQWMRANHAFHDVIYRAADAPLVEQMAKSARRTFSGPAVWAPGDEVLDELYERNVREHRAIRQALQARSAEGSKALAHEHVMHSFELLDTILQHVGQAPRDWHSVRSGR